MRTLVFFLCISAVVLMVMVGYSLCVMAKDEDDAEQVKWLRKQRKRNKKSKDGKRE